MLPQNRCQFTTHFSAWCRDLCFFFALFFVVRKNIFAAVGGRRNFGQVKKKNFGRGGALGPIFHFGPNSEVRPVFFTLCFFSKTKFPREFFSEKKTQSEKNRTHLQKKYFDKNRTESQLCGRKSGGRRSRRPRRPNFFFFIVFFFHRFTTFFFPYHGKICFRKGKAPGREKWAKSACRTSIQCKKKRKANQQTEAKSHAVVATRQLPLVQYLVSR